MRCKPFFPTAPVIEGTQQYRRIDTTSRDPITTLEFEQGGITLERIHLTYAPFDWFNVIAGRFLTPFGIWNVDHGSPVVLPARIPMLQYREFVPLAQTGLQFYGRFFPSGTLQIDYAVTFSNGRGPMESVYDLDEDKGAGLRLKLTYTGRKVTFFAGTYGYTGAGGDTQKQIVAVLNDNGSANTSKAGTHLNIVDTSIFREYDMTSDASPSFFGITLQAGAAITRVMYSQNAAIGDLETGFNGGNIAE